MVNPYFIHNFFKIFRFLLGISFLGFAKRFFPIFFQSYNYWWSVQMQRWILLTNEPQIFLKYEMYFQYWLFLDIFNQILYLFGINWLKSWKKKCSSNEKMLGKNDAWRIYHKKEMRHRNKTLIVAIIGWKNKVNWLSLRVTQFKQIVQSIPNDPSIRPNTIVLGIWLFASTTNTEKLLRTFFLFEWFFIQLRCSI